MKIKIKKNPRIIYIYIILLICMIGYNYSNLYHWLIAINIIMFIAIFLIAQISLFSLKNLTILWVYLAISFQYFYKMAYGNLALTTLHIDYEHINVYICLYNIVFYTVLECTNIVEMEKRKIQNLEFMKLSSSSINICCLIAISFSFVSFPNLPFVFDSGNRFQALLPGNAWNHVVLVALIFLLPYWGKARVKITYFLCIFWFLSHFERVDIVGLLMALFVFVFVLKKTTLGLRIILKYSVISFFGVVILLNIGNIRDGRDRIKASDFISKIIVQQTASDVGHVFVSAVNYSNEEDKLLGSTYITYLDKAMPLFGDANSCDYILQEKYGTAGGDFIIDEPLMNFGVSAIPFFALIELGVIYFLLHRHRGVYSSYLYLLILSTVPRVNWYGIYYIEKAVIYILPLMIIMLRVINSRTKGLRKRR